MSESFKLQDPGEGIHEAQILEVHVSEGDSVNEGDNLFVVETDKAAVEVPSPFTGTIEEVRVGKGDDVSVGDTLLTYTESGDDREKDGDGEDDGDDKGEDREDTEDDEAQDRDAGAEDEDEDREDTEKDEEQDREAAAEDGDEDREDTEKDEDDSAGTAREQPGRSRGGHAAAAPATRKLAEELDVDIERVDGSGPDGRVEAEDVRAAAGETGDKEKEPGGGRGALPDFSRWGEIETVDFAGIRRRIAEKMDRSWQTIPHVMHGDRFDITRLEQVRSDYEDQSDQLDGKLTITVFALKAVAIALQEFPRFNASLDIEARQLILKHYCHIGVAVATDEGLLVPVIRDVDKKSLADLAGELGQLAERARDGALQADDMRGGSITITNPGAIGGTTFTPIINYPEVAIVGLGAARREPTVTGEGGTVENRLMLPLAVSFDHRVNDGADAARFTARVGSLITSPADMLLEA